MTEKVIEKINKLRKERNAVILAHNYQRGEVQDIADFTGDSLELSQRAAKTDARVILFCGVHFMAETAKIISPEKQVLLPDMNAGCPMANMITARELKGLKDKHPDALVVTYVNSTARIKALSDICCTSANAVKVVDSLPEGKAVIFIPDQSLGQYVSSKVKKEREFILWNGYCPTHHRILARDIIEKRKEHPLSMVVVHPECTSDVIELANEVNSTSGMLRYAKRSQAEELVIGTEIGIIHRLQKEVPDKNFYPASELADCPNMKLTTLEKILWSLEDMAFEINIPDEVINKARQPIERMLEVS